MREQLLRMSLHIQTRVYACCFFLSCNQLNEKNDVWVFIKTTILFLTINDVVRRVSIKFFRKKYVETTELQRLGRVARKTNL